MPPSNNASTPVRLSDVITTYRPSKSLHNSSSGSTVTSLDFDDSGEWLIAACDDETIQVYDCKMGKHSKTLFSKKYGVHLARFTHSSTNCIYASTKQDGIILFLLKYSLVFLLNDNGSFVRLFGLDVSNMLTTLPSASFTEKIIHRYNSISFTSRQFIHSILSRSQTRRYVSRSFSHIRSLPLYLSRQHSPSLGPSLL